MTQEWRSKTGVPPSDKIVLLVGRFLASSKRDMLETLDEFGKMSMFSEIDNRFLTFQMTAKCLDTVVIHEFTQDEWLDMINVMDKKNPKAKWSKMEY